MQVAFNFLTALNPASPTFDESNQKDVRKRPSGGVQKPSKAYPRRLPRALCTVLLGAHHTLASYPCPCHGDDLLFQIKLRQTFSVACSCCRWTQSRRPRSSWASQTSVSDAKAY